MRKVVDSNYLQADELVKYFSKDKRNVVVLTDYAAMEIYKGSSIDKVYKATSILRQFPERVIVLKSTLKVCGIKSRGKGFHKRLIDESQTSGFSAFCKQLTKAEAGKRIYESGIRDHMEAANDHMNRILGDAERVKEAIKMFSKVFSDSELRILRKKLPYPSELKKKILENACYVSVNLFEDHPEVNQVPSFKNLKYSYIFRYSLCAMLLTVDWISEGGASGVRNERMRNDMVDLHFAAYATIFDGLLTKDLKAHRIYTASRDILENLFDA